MIDTRRFIVAFSLLWILFIGEFLLFHVRVLKGDHARVRHLDLRLQLEPEEGRALVSATLEIHSEQGGPLPDLSLILPVAATRVQIHDADGRSIPFRRRSEKRLYLTGVPLVGGGREWNLERFAEPRVDLKPGKISPSIVHVEFELDGSLLRGRSSLRAGRTLLAGLWAPRQAVPPGAPPARFTYSMQVRVPEPVHAVASGHLLGRASENGWATSSWSSVWPVSDIWVLSGSLSEHRVSDSQRQVIVYVRPDQEAALAEQIAQNALAAWGALEATVGPLPETEWHLAVTGNLGAIARAWPPLMLLDSGLFLRPALRSGSIQEQRSWIAQEMARAWLRGAQYHTLPNTARTLMGATASVLAQVALSGLDPGEFPGGDSPAPRADDLTLRLEWMMRCRAYAGDGAHRAPLTPRGTPVSLLLSAAKLPAILTTIASQLGSGTFVQQVTGESNDSLVERLASARGGAALATLLGTEWLPDLSVQEVQSDGEGVSVIVAEEGQAVVPLKVDVMLEDSAGTLLRRRVLVPPGGRAIARFEGVSGWRRAEVDPDRWIYQANLDNDVVPETLNPWLSVQAIWDARRAVTRGDFELAVERAKVAARLDPTQREAHYWAGFSLVKMGRGAEALPWLEQALEGPLTSDIVAVETLYQLGQAHEMLRHSRRARELYQAVVEGAWTSFSVERAQRALKRLNDL
ncbi:MAG: hypothetical protein O7F16_06225 [Acidobacteria bacterium]|nr:hypothetical protein [Acidobacteriota bacterium]